MKRKFFGVVGATLSLTFIPSPFLRRKGRGKDCRGEGPAKQKVTTWTARSEICCAACTAGNCSALKMKSVLSIATEQPHPLSCSNNYLLFSNPATVTRTSSNWTLKAADLSVLIGAGKSGKVQITTRVNKSCVIYGERYTFVGLFPGISQIAFKSL